MEAKEKRPQARARKALPKTVANAVIPDAAQTEQEPQVLAEAQATQDAGKDETTKQKVLPPCRGILKFVEDEKSGAACLYHLIVAYAIDMREGKTTCTLCSYVSEDKFIEGRHAISSTGISIDTLPPRGVDATEWIYAMLTRVAPPQTGEDTTSASIANKFASGSLLM